MNIKKPATIIDEVKDAILSWDYFAQQAKVKPELKELISDHLLIL